MAYENFKNTNNAQAEALTGFSASATTVILKTGQGALFGSTFPMLVKLEQFTGALVTKREIVRVTARSGDTLTIVRSQGACPSAWNATTQTTTAFSFDPTLGMVTVTGVATAEQLQDIQDELALAVKTTGTQTIAGEKTITSEIQSLLNDNGYNGIRGKTNSKSIGSLSFFGPSWSQASRQDSVEITSGTGIKITLRPGDQDCITVLPNLNVGIGTNNPTEKLQVDGNIKSSQLIIRNDSIENHSGNTDDSGINFNYIGYNGGTTRFRDVNFFNGKSQLIFRVIGNAGKIKYTDGSQGNGKVLTSDANGYATWQGAIGAKAYTSSFSSTLTLTTVPFPYESFDTNAFHDTVTNNSRLTIPAGQAGTYQIIANGKTSNAGAYTQIGIELWKNGSLYTVGSSNYNQFKDGFSMTEIDTCIVGDYYEIKIQTDINRTWDYIGFSIIKL